MKCSKTKTFFSLHMGLCLLSVLMLNSFAHAKPGEKTVLKKGNSELSFGDLSIAEQQNLFDIEFETFQRQKALLENHVLDSYYSQEAEKKKLNKQQVEEQENKTGDISEKDLKKFYEENKARIPYPFEQVSGEIKNILQGQKRQENRSKLIEKALKATKSTIVLAEPTAPLVEIDTSPYHTFGKKGAKVKIVEFADYQCPHCKTATEAFKKIRANYKDKIEYVYIDYPINQSGISKTVAMGAACAAKQNKYWEYHELAFSKQSSLTKESVVTLAKDLKLDEPSFVACVANAETSAFIERSKAEGDRVGVSGTPTIFVNGRRSRTAHTPEAISKEIDELLKK